MEKQDVLKLFGGNKQQAAKELRIARQSIYVWPDDGPIPLTAQSKVRDYMLRVGMPIPKKWMPR